MALQVCDCKKNFGELEVGWCLWVASFDGFWALACHVESLRYLPWFHLYLSEEWVEGQICGRTRATYRCLYTGQSVS